MGKDCEVMIDIETLSCKPTATILTIGAIKFSREDSVKKLEDMETFYERVIIPREDKGKFDINKDTQSWWNRQEYSAVYEAFDNPDRKYLPEVLKLLREFIPQNSIIWANSPSFDCVILENAYRQYNMITPWVFYNTRDLRTIMDVAFMKHSDFKHIKEEAHNALKDCEYQVNIVKECYSRILRRY